MVWGSDAPFVGHEHTPYGQVLDTFVQLVPDAAKRHAMGSHRAPRMVLVGAMHPGAQDVA